MAVVSFFKYNGALTLSRAPLRRALAGEGEASPAPSPALYARAAIAAGSGSVHPPSLVPVSLAHAGNPRSEKLGSVTTTAHGDRKRLSHRLEAVLATPRDTPPPRAGGARVEIERRRRGVRWDMAEYVLRPGRR